MSLPHSALLDSFFYQPNRDWNICPDFLTDEVVLNAGKACKIVCLYVHTPSIKKAGSIFLLHGRGGNASRYSYYAKPLIKEGFDVFIVDWRGYGKSGGHPDHMNVLEDSRLALNYFLSRSDEKKPKKIIWGLSLGGQVAIRLAREFPDRFDALVTEGSVCSFEQAATDYYHKVFKIPVRLFGKKGYSAEKDIKKIDHLPKLIIHSTEDKEISFKNAEILFQNAKEPKSLLRIKGNHLYGLNRQNATSYIQAIKKISGIG